MPAIDPELVNVSIVQRPDAICLDFRTAFTLGPIFRQDSSQGNIARVWKCWVNELNEVWLQRANDADDGWDAAELVFQFVGEAGVELDVAFDQNTNLVVSINRPTGVGGLQEVWLYYYDSITAAYIFANICEGRCAKVVLDDVLDAVNSDVLLFYMKDSINKLCVRSQRERYLDEVPIFLGNGIYVDSVDGYIDDAFRASEGRVHVLVGRNDPVTGRYAYSHNETSLYPQTVELERFQIGAAIQPGSFIYVVYQVYVSDEEEEMKVLVPDVQSGILVVAIIEVPGTLYQQPQEDMKIGVAIQPSLLVVAVIVVPGTLYTQPQEDAKINVNIQSAAIPQVVIEHTTYDKEELKVNVAIQSGSLVVL